MNLLPLEEFRARVGWNPYHFWGLSHSELAPVQSGCNTVMREYAWQDAYGVGREEIRDGIERAEKKIMDYLGYPVAPIYVVETLDWPTYFNNLAWRRLPYGGDWKRIVVQLHWGKLLQIGFETFTDLDTPVVVLSDGDGDGLKETFTITIPTVETDPNKIFVEFVEADRPFNKLDNHRWRVQPVNVKIEDANTTIVGKSWTIVKPILYEGMNSGKSDIDPTDITNFAGTLLVSSRSMLQDGDQINTSQATLLWNTDLPNCPPNSSDPAAIGMAVARAGIHNDEMGEIVPAAAILADGIWRDDFCRLYREPDRLTVRYSAGLPLDGNGEMDYDMRQVITRMAIAEIGRPVSGCEEANRVFYHWQFDLSRGGGRNTEQFQTGQKDLNNPFGKSRGHIWAWDRVKELALMRGVAY